MKKLNDSYFIAQMLGGDINVLSNCPYYDNLEDRYGVSHTIYSSNRDGIEMKYCDYYNYKKGFIKENKQIKFYEITSNEYYHCQRLYDRFVETFIGMIKIISPNVDGNKSIFVLKEQGNYVIGRKIGISKYEFIQFTVINVSTEHGKIWYGIGDFPSYIGTKTVIPTTIEVFDIIKDFVFNSIKEIHQYYTDILEEKVNNCK